jgi:hypothetical protein
MNIYFLDDDFMTLLAWLYTVESMMNHELENIWMEAVVTWGKGKSQCPVRDSSQVPADYESKALRNSQVQSDKSLLLCIYCYFWQVCIYYNFEERNSSVRT